VQCYLKPSPKIKTILISHIKTDKQFLNPMGLFPLGIALFNRRLSMSNFTIGQVVNISDKRPKPPRHHRKKLKEWESNHFKGVIKELREDKHCVLVENTAATIPGVIEFNFEISLNDSVRKIESVNDGEE
jgi:hypothetical protein